jgi:RNA 3'-terminal phosphate cyclase (ATP)
LALHWLPYLRQIGYDADLTLEQAGFYPKGGGRVHAIIRPVQAIAPLRLTGRGDLRQIGGLSAVANLDVSIAERQRRQALQRLHGHGLPAEIEIARLPSPVQGTLLLLLAEFEQARCCYYALGERGKPAERVADEAVNAFEAFLATDAAIDQYLADQLLLPLTLASGVSVLRTARVTEHLVTNAAVIRHFLSAKIEIQGEIGGPGLVRIAP